MGLWQWWKTSSEYGQKGIKVLKTTGGFSKTELLIVLAVVAIAAALSIPSLRALQMSLDYRQAAREIASALRQARSLAIAENWEHRVEFDVAGKKYRMTRGNRANNSSTWPTIVRDWIYVPSDVTMRRNNDCGSTGNVNIQFNPNGTANSQYVCVADSTGAMQYRVGVASSVTGRVKVE